MIMYLRKALIEGALRAEQLQYVGVGEYERSSERTDYRNGYWSRWIILKDGRLEIKRHLSRILCLGVEFGIEQLQ
jgi:transposase-like protein